MKSYIRMCVHTLTIQGLLVKLLLWGWGRLSLFWGCPTAFSLFLAPSVPAYLQLLFRGKAMVIISLTHNLSCCDHLWSASLLRAPACSLPATWLRTNLSHPSRPGCTISACLCPAESLRALSPKTPFPFGNLTPQRDPNIHLLNV